MRISRAFAFLAIVTCLSTPGCETIPIGSDRADAGRDGAGAGDAGTDARHNCNDPGYGCPGNEICKPLQLGGWSCFPPGVEP